MWQKIRSFLDGKKSILTAIATGVIGILMKEGVIGADMGKLLMMIGGVLYGVFLRIGVKKSGS